MKDKIDWGRLARWVLSFLIASCIITAALNP